MPHFRAMCNIERKQKTPYSHYFLIMDLLIQPWVNYKRGGNDILTCSNIFFKIFMIFNRHMPQLVGHLRVAISKIADNKQITRQLHSELFHS